MSSTKRKVNRFAFLQDADGSTNFSSDPLDVSSVDKYAIEISHVGDSFLGAMFFEGSINGFGWATIGIAQLLSGPSGTIFIDSSVKVLGGFSVVPFPKIRLRFIASAGTGTVNAWLNAKEN